MLYHISEESGITRFEPRPGPMADQAVVWAVSGERMHNYLSPRDCPRVTFYAGHQTTDADRDRLLGSSEAVFAFESDWLSRVRRARLFCYRLPNAGFTCIDECAGYYQSTAAVVPEGFEIVANCLAALVSRSIEARIMPTLWSLQDAVVASTVSYSIIRMRNAAPRPTGAFPS